MFRLLPLVLALAAGCSTDADRDGYAADVDCNNADPEVHPDAPDTVGNAVDENCDGLDGVDDDNDSHPSVASGGDDCNDDDPRIHPDYPDELYDGVDADCDGRDSLPDDDDADGYQSTVDDCDDTDASVSPGADEIPYDGIDQDCDGFDLTDLDGDGIEVDLDCDDTDPLLGAGLDPNTRTPAPGSTGVLPTRPVAVTLDAPEPGAVLTVTDASGNAVMGSMNADGSRLSFVPDTPFAGLTDYTATLEYSCGTEQWAFTTMDLGTPIGDPSGLVGNTYVVDLSTGTVVEPPGIGGLLSGYLVPLMVNVAATDGDDLELVIAASDIYSSPAAQETCWGTTPRLATDFSADPYFFIAPQTVQFPMESVLMTYEDFTLQGGLGDGGNQIVGAWMSTNLDTRALVPLLTPGQGDAGVCNLAGLLGATCNPCADGTPYCMQVLIEDLNATRQFGSYVQQQHLPQQTSPQAGSVNVCDISTCAWDPVCWP